jgi:hypothetical protein
MMDGCEHLVYYGSYKFHKLAAEQLLSGKLVQYGRQVYGPFITYKITPAGSLSSSQPGGPQVSPLAFGLITRTFSVVYSQSNAQL